MEKTVQFSMINEVMDLELNQFSNGEWRVLL